MSLKVVKFGGSSLADAPHFEMVRNIVRAEDARRYVVPSAPGKRYPDDIKVTDLLYQCYEASRTGAPIDPFFSRIETRFRDIVAGLGLDLDLSDEFTSIRNAILHRAGRDYAASRGEYLSGIVLSKYLGFPFIDAADVIYFADDGTFDAERTNDVLSKKLREVPCAVIPGFYGSMPNGTIRTFSRGGSDITGAIVSRAAMADLYENWTDVSGFKMADPRIITDAKTIDVVTYRELRELSYMGATVLHEESIFPVRFVGIPINIRNTNAPDAAGTMIVPEADGHDAAKIITGIAGKRGFSVINIEKERMNVTKGFIREVLEAVERTGLNVEHIPSGIDTMSIILSTEDLQSEREHVINNICASVQPDSISVEDGLALIAVVGRGMAGNPGTAAKIFASVASAGINIRMIDQGSSELNVILGVHESDFERTVDAIYRAFVR